MRALVDRPRRFLFSLATNKILVETHAGSVQIRAARYSTAREKLFFVRHLADEGFIPETYRRIEDHNPDAHWGLTWIIDDSWLIDDSARLGKATMQILRLISWAGLLWLVLMAFAFLHALP